MGERYSSRSNLLQEAEKIITTDRNKTYGEPDEDFRRIAAMWNALGFRMGDREVTSADVALAMVSLKLSRLTWSPEHRDSWMDIAGYAACGYETAQLQSKPQDTEQQVLNPNGRLIVLGNEALKTSDHGKLQRFGYLISPAGDPVLCENGPCGAGHTFSEELGCGFRLVHDAAV